MKFLLTNDDGIDAVGLSLLSDVCAELGAVTVVAPAEEQSGVSDSALSATRVQSAGVPASA